MSAAANRGVEPQRMNDRQALVEIARTQWAERLTDLSRRNPLLYFRPLKRGSLDLTTAEPKALRDLLFGSREVGLKSLWPADEAQREDARKRLTTIYRKAVENREERGIATLVLGCGLATWKSKDGGSPVRCPLFLLPIAVELRPSPKIRRELEWQANSVLPPALRRDYAVAIGQEALDQIADGLNDSGSPESLAESLAMAFEGVARLGRQVPEFAIDQTWRCLTNLAFQKMAMVQEIQEGQEAMSASLLVASLAGDPEAARALKSGGPENQDLDLDRVPAREELLLFNADGSQQAAIHAALRDSLVIYGPPGTGKSQTIANFIGASVVRGEKILFVSQKRAALEVVQERLKRRGLGHLILDLSARDLTAKKIAAQLRESLEAFGAAGSTAGHAATHELLDKTHEPFDNARNRLTAYREWLHSPSAIVGISRREIWGRLLQLPKRQFEASIWAATELSRLTPALAEIKDRVRLLAEHESEFLAGLSDNSSWAPFLPQNGGTGREEIVRRVEEVLGWSGRLRDGITALSTLLQPLSERFGFQSDISLGDIEKVVQSLGQLSKLLPAYQPGVLDLEIDDAREALQPATRGAWVRFWHFLTSSRYRSARRALRLMRRTPAAAAALHSEATEIAAALASAKPQIQKFEYDTIVTVPSALSSTTKNLIELFAEAPWENWKDAQLRTLKAKAERLEIEASEAPAVGDVRRLVSELRRSGVGQWLDAVRRAQLPAGPDGGQWIETLDRLWLESAICDLDGRASHVSGAVQTENVKSFCDIDRRRLALAPEEVLFKWRRGVDEAFGDDEEEGLVKREAYKKSKHRRLRQLLAEAPNAVLALRPCFMASPLTVSQLFPPLSDRPLFDVVVFDEASQMPPEEAVPSITRARRMVVAGDDKQLPPTAFFDADDTETDAADEQAEGPHDAGMESLLDAAQSLPVRKEWLRWHYRSRDERLICFSNRHLYGDRLITFPGVGGGTPPCSFIRVEGGESTDSSAEEVRRVVDLIFSSAREQPEKSLGVIALGRKHADRIDAEWRRRLEDEKSDAILEFFREDSPERFFIKNLESVQGDERDAIILTLGYNNRTAGRLNLKFGPLNQEGGERRLNVAVSRARARMTVVASFSPDELDASRTDARGVQLLKAYLEYARSGSLPDVQAAARQPENPFEQDIFDALSGKGVRLEPQWGVSGYKIDFAVRHPTDGRFVLAIECDGASYHSSRSARERDRLRQEQLEEKGWMFHRIWSPDWFEHRDKEISRALDSIAAACQRADRVGDGRVARTASEPSIPARPMPPPERVHRLDDGTTPGKAPLPSASGVRREPVSLNGLSSPPPSGGSGADGLKGGAGAAATNRAVVLAALTEAMRNAAPCQCRGRRTVFFDRYDNGPFLRCSSCGTIDQAPPRASLQSAVDDLAIKCPTCSAKMIVRTVTGFARTYLACSNYPGCRKTFDWRELLGEGRSVARGGRPGNHL